MARHHSRGGYYGAGERRKAHWWVPLLLVGATSAALPILKVVPPQLLEQRFAELSLGGFVLERTDVPMAWRMVVWRALVARWRMWPFIGCGAGSVDQYVSEVVGVVYAPHSEYVRILFEAGLVGILFFGVTMFFIFKDAQDGAVR